MSTIYIIHRKELNKSRFSPNCSLSTTVAEATLIMNSNDEKIVGIYEVNTTQKTIKSMEAYLNHNSKIWLQTKDSSEKEYLDDKEGVYFLIYEDDRSNYDVVQADSIEELKEKFLRKNGDESELKFMFKADLQGVGRFMPLKVTLANFDVEFESAL